jgi:hypothetical protein
MKSKSDLTNEMAKARHVGTISVLLHPVSGRRRMRSCLFLFCFAAVPKAYGVGAAALLPWAGFFQQSINE